VIVDQQEFNHRHATESKRRMAQRSFASVEPPPHELNKSGAINRKRMGV